MGARADFYIGRGKDAEWLCSIAWDGYPDGIPKATLRCTTPQGFRRSVANFLKDRSDTSLPSDGWPWPWDDSGTTDFAYALDRKKVYASCFGGPWRVAAKYPANGVERKGEKVEFPNMKGEKRRPMFGAHSGVI